jgi:hypothetical protein
MAEENIGYTVTFKTRTEGDAGKKVVDTMKDIRAEQEKLNRLRNPESLRQSIGGEYDLSRAIDQAEKATKKSTFTTIEDNFVKVRARQAAQALVDEMKREQLGTDRLVEAKKQVTKASSAAGRSVQNVAFQVQDLGTQLAAGTSAAQAFGQQLPQLLGGFGMWGAIAGGVVALGALVLKMGEGKEKTEDFKEAAEKLKDALEQLRETKAQEYTEDLAYAVQILKEQTDDLREAEVQRIDTQNKVADSQRRVQEAQDKSTASMLDYMEAVLGLDVTQQRAALAQRDHQRAAEAATASATAELNKQKLAYDNLATSISDAKQEMVAAEEERQRLSQQESDLNKRLRIAEGSGKRGEAGDIEMELANVKALAAMQDQILRETPKTIAQLYKQGYAMANQISALQTTTQAELEAINAELEAANQGDSIKNLISQNQKITGDLTTAMTDVKATTPLQAQAAADITAALADGKLTAEEAKRLSGQLVTLHPALTEAMNGNVAQVDKLIALVKDVATKQKAQDAQIEGLRNGIR